VSSADDPTALAYGCWRIDVYGSSVASSTPMAQRFDPALTAAMTVLAANKQARLAGALATVGRIETVPARSDSVASRVSLWLDVRAEAVGEADAIDTVDALLAAVVKQATERAVRDGTRVEVALVARGRR
jgi:N-carbamoyl-L-amino-acid hydrolase